MYWFRDGSPFSFLPWLAVSVTWLLGGWLIATHTFRLERRERLIIGIGLGLIPYLWFINILSHWTPASWAFILAGILVLLVGIAFAWRGERPFLDWRDLEVWRLLIVGLILTWLFTRIGRGLTIIDDPKNVSIISTMAAGDIPPHFYMNSTFYFAYHYAFQLIGASMMRLGGLFPWSAFDLSKAVLGAYCILLAYLIGKRYIKHELGGVTTAFVMAFATGTRYLLLLLPTNIITKLDSMVVFTNTKAPLSQVLTSIRPESSGPPVSFIYAYMNGIEAWPLFISVQAGPGTLSFVCLFLIWLLATRSARRFSFLLFVMIFSIWALAWESTFGLFVVGAISVTLYYWWKYGNIHSIGQEVLALLLSLPVVIFQGGTITQILRKEILGLGSTGVVASEQSVAGFALRWPLSFPSSHLEPLNLSSPLEALVGFLEFGPILLLAPWISIWAWRRFRQGDWAIGALIVSTWVGFAVPILFKYKTDRDVPRLMAHSFDTWIMLLVIMFWDYSGKWSGFFKKAAIIVIFLSVFGGIVLAGSALTATQRHVLTKNFVSEDSHVASDLWNELPPGSEVFDPERWRATAITGRLTRAGKNSRVNLPEWVELRQNPYANDLLAEGYEYVYIDEEWWEQMSDASKASLSAPCVVVMAEYDFGNGNFRRFVDISKCHP
jgi:hypothetical protein